MPGRDIDELSPRHESTGHMCLLSGQIPSQIGREHTITLISVAISCYKEEFEARGSSCSVLKAF